MGMCVVGLGIFGLGVLLILYRNLGLLGDSSSNFSHARSVYDLQSQYDKPRGQSLDGLISQNAVVLHRLLWIYVLVSIYYLVLFPMLCQFLQDMPHL